LIYYYEKLNDNNNELTNDMIKQDLIIFYFRGFKLYYTINYINYCGLNKKDTYYLLLRMWYTYICIFGLRREVMKK